MSKESFELKTENDVVRFSMGSIVDNNGSQTKGRVKTKRVKMSKKAKLNELRFYRLKAKKKMTSPNPEVRIRYKLEKTENDVVRFSMGSIVDNNGSQTKGRVKTKRVKMSKKAKLNELRFYRLKAKKKMTSPNPEVRIRYKLEKAKRKEVWLIEKLRKFEVPKAPAETYDPEILTEEERHYLKRTGEKKKNYVPVGRRGVFGGVVLNMHLHWKKHETVKVICKPCKPGQIHEYAEELTRLSKGIVIDIKADNTIIFYRGKNYVQPQVMSPLDTLSKDK
ncbi:putative crm domain-containing protein, partial [Quercus suber]